MLMYSYYKVIYSKSKLIFEGKLVYSRYLRIIRAFFSGCIALFLSL